MKNYKQPSRRSLLNTSLSAAAITGLAAIVPSRVFGHTSPSNQINIGAIGVGRHRACSTCLLHHMAMKTQRKLYWDPVKERFKNDDEANAMLSRPQRAPYRFS